jgi:hypothetical protein
MLCGGVCIDLLFIRYYDVGSDLRWPILLIWFLYHGSSQTTNHRLRRQ